MKSYEGREKFHFIGIGGVGMSAIAGVLLQKGYFVSGCDLQEGSNINRLKQLGATICLGHSPEHLSGIDVVVVSSAISPTNPEVVRAKELGLEVVKRGDMLARLMKEKDGIAIAGTHGKTTTTSMIAAILERAGLDPTVLVGGEVNDIGGNAKLGNGNYIVSETDESDGSFLKLDPFAAVITNIEDDHLDYYGSIDSLVEAFKFFANAGNPNGFVVICSDDCNAAHLVPAIKKRVVTYGADLERVPDYRASSIQLSGLGSRFTMSFNGRCLGDITLRVPGLHNVRNALAAVAVATQLGIDFNVCAEALGSFKEVKRRFETVDIVNCVRIVDDYGHHPTEVAATLDVAKMLAEGRVICVFQPHRYTRTKLLYERFAEVLSGVDELIITDIYPAGEAPIPGVTAQLIADAVKRKSGRRPLYLHSLSHIVEHLADISRPGDLIITIGAGNVGLVGRQVACRLRETLSKKRDPGGDLSLASYS